VKPLSGPVLTAAEMRAAELACGVPLGELMERAGTALAEAVWRFGGGASVLVLCGPGNNGGDGYVAARLLREQGLAVQVAADDEPKTDLARAARARWGGTVDHFADARPACVFLDALFGTGMRQPLIKNYWDALCGAWSTADLTIAADVPSGVGSDDGADLGVARADITIAFGAAKPAHLLMPAAARCGQVLIADIGIPVSSDAWALARPALSAPGPNHHKYTRGMVAIVAGDMAGAATLGVAAAARCAGYTVLVGQGDAPANVVRRGFEATLSDPKLDAMLVGPGMADTPANRAKLDAALASSVPLVLDAGALAMVTPEVLLQRPAPTILTPHAGEFDRMFGKQDADKLSRTRNAALRSGCTVVFKGSDTVISSPDGRATLCPTGSPWLATAGTGDVLAGIMTAMLAREDDPFEAANAAVWLHGEAARRAGPGLIADDLAAHLPAALAACA
jgi:ADP-dependent NAD(P)H-hydrate dehydratase / NAD(P)H-hydrate epimerase